jgi:hypothetical protein
MGEPLSAEAVSQLVQCEAWPMVVTTRKSWFSRPMLTFICPNCHFKGRAQTALSELVARSALQIPAEACKSDRPSGERAQPLM